MSSKNIIALLLLIAGAFALYTGYSQSNSPMAEVTEAVTGSYSDETMSYLIGGAIAAIAGLLLLFKK